MGHAMPLPGVGHVSALGGTFAVWGGGADAIDLELVMDLVCVVGFDSEDWLGVYDVPPQLPPVVGL